MVKYSELREIEAAIPYAMRAILPTMHAQHARARHVVAATQTVGFGKGYL